jgi:hypothetical protein
MLRYRQGGLVKLFTDYKDEERPPKEYVYYEQH